MACIRSRLYLTTGHCPAGTLRDLMHDFVARFFYDCEALFVEVAHDDCRCAQQPSAGSRGAPYGSCASDIHSGTGLYASDDASVIPSGKDVREVGKFEDVLHRLIFVGEL